MKGTTHMLFGVTVYASLAKMGLVPGEPVYYIAPTIGALLPDIDHGGSFISRRIKPLSMLIGVFANHRGPTHSLVATCIAGIASLGVAIILWPWLPVTACMGFVLGYASHILIDMLTVEGTEVWWPDKKNYHFTSLRTGGIGETVIALCLVAWIVALFAGDIATLVKTTAPALKILKI